MRRRKQAAQTADIQPAAVPDAAPTPAAVEAAPTPADREREALAARLDAVRSLDYLGIVKAVGHADAAAWWALAVDLAKAKEQAEMWATRAQFLREIQPLLMLKLDGLLIAAVATGGIAAIGGAPSDQRPTFSEGKAAIAHWWELAQALVSAVLEEVQARLAALESYASVGTDPPSAAELEAARPQASIHDDIERTWRGQFLSVILAEGPTGLPWEYCAGAEQAAQAETQAPPEAA